MDIRQLKYFVAIVDCGSLSKAAEQLCVAQPSLSQQVAGLETELKTTLLLRSHQGVQPTEASRALYLRARDVLRQKRLKRCSPVRTSLSRIWRPAPHNARDSTRSLWLRVFRN
ncbi:LysR family transcriptional regulator [Paraburkholderia sp.]|uniref:LysR family transcriptional regulator n=1 Tax=Paraburkholderia sp. TaxID=1926495 RepID=UPI0039C98B21